MRNTFLRLQTSNGEAFHALLKTIDKNLQQAKAMSESQPHSDGPGPGPRRGLGAGQGLSSEYSSIDEALLARALRIFDHDAVFAEEKAIDLFPLLDAVKEAFVAWPTLVEEKGFIVAYSETFLALYNVAKSFAELIDLSSLSQQMKNEVSFNLIRRILMSFAESLNAQLEIWVEDDSYRKALFALATGMASFIKHFDGSYLGLSLDHVVAVFKAAATMRVHSEWMTFLLPSEHDEPENVSIEIFACKTDDDCNFLKKIIDKILKNRELTQAHVERLLLVFPADFLWDALKNKISSSNATPDEKEAFATLLAKTTTIDFEFVRSYLHEPRVLLQVLMSIVRRDSYASFMDDDLFFPTQHGPRTSNELDLARIVKMLSYLSTKSNISNSDVSRYLGFVFRLIRDRKSRVNLELSSCFPKDFKPVSKHRPMFLVRRDVEGLGFATNQFRTHTMPDWFELNWKTFLTGAVICLIFLVLAVATHGGSLLASGALFGSKTTIAHAAGTMAMRHAPWTGPAFFTATSLTVFTAVSAFVGTVANKLYQLYTRSQGFLRLKTRQVSKVALNKHNLREHNVQRMTAVKVSKFLCDLESSEELSEDRKVSKQMDKATELVLAQPSLVFGLLCYLRTVRPSALLALLGDDTSQGFMACYDGLKQKPDAIPAGDIALLSQFFTGTGINGEPVKPASMAETSQFIAEQRRLINS